MKIPKNLQNFNLKIGEPNFLIGVAGNGMSTRLHSELFNKPTHNTHYFSYINFTDNSENAILLELMNAIIISALGNKITDESITTPHIPFSIFKTGVELLQKHKINPVKMMIIFDEFQHCTNFSNAFFFTLDKILSIKQFIPNIQLTSIIISDRYIDYQTEAPSEGLGKLFFHYMNLHIIPGKTLNEYIEAKITPIPKNFSKKTLEKIYKMGGSVPSLFFSLVKNYADCNGCDMLDNYDVEWKIQDIWDSLGKDNQEILKNIARKKDFRFKNKIQQQYLEETGLVDTNQTKFKSELLEEFTKKQIHIEIMNRNDHLSIGNIVINMTDLSPQLEKILYLLHNKKGTLVTRDEIAESIWGNEYLNKYSDYAIDKQISKLRKILTKQDPNSNYLQTRKGKGYILDI